jgi:hypothetical protein
MDAKYSKHFKMKKKTTNENQIRKTRKSPKWVLSKIEDKPKFISKQLNPNQLKDNNQRDIKPMSQNQIYYTISSSYYYLMRQNESEKNYLSRGS